MAPRWEEVTARAKSLGWTYGAPRRSNCFEWYKTVGGTLHTSSSALWKEEVEGPLWKQALGR